MYSWQRSGSVHIVSFLTFSFSSSLDLICGGGYSGERGLCHASFLGKSGPSHWHERQQTFLACRFFFPNTDHMAIARWYILLKLNIFLVTRKVFNTTKVQTSWVSFLDLYWENRIDKRKRSIPTLQPSISCRPESLPV